MSLGPFEKRVEHLTEILSGSYEVKNLGWTGNSVEYSFNSEGGQEFVIECEQSKPKTFLRQSSTSVVAQRVFRALGVEFPKGFKTSQWGTFFQEPRYVTEVSFRNNSPSVARGNRFGVTGTGKGDATRILGTVIQTIQNHVRREKTEVLYFSAKEPSRRKLYAHFARRFKNPLYTYVDAGDGNSVFASKDTVKKVKMGNEVAMKKYRDAEAAHTWSIQNVIGWMGHFQSAGEGFALSIGLVTNWDVGQHKNFEALHLRGFDVPWNDISNNVYQIRVSATEFKNPLYKKWPKDTKPIFRMLDEFIARASFEGIYYKGKVQNFQTELTKYLKRKLPRFDVGDAAYNQVVALNPAFLAQYEVDGVMA